jgi:hypothetical protein
VEDGRMDNVSVPTQSAPPADGDIIQSPETETSSIVLGTTE